MEITKEFLIKAMEERIFLKARNGEKVLISYYNQKNEKYPFMGYSIDKDKDILHESWNHQGITYVDSNKPNPRDIVAVWKEPYFLDGIELSERPLFIHEVIKTKSYFTPVLHDQSIYEFRYTGNSFTNRIINNGLAFKTKQGAEDFLNACLNNIRANNATYCINLIKE